MFGENQTVKNAPKGSQQCTMKENSIHLIDFGFSSRYLNPKTSQHKEM